VVVGGHTFSVSVEAGSLVKVADSVLTMPAIVIGADTPTGGAIVAALLAHGGEIRSFVTDPVAAGSLKAQGVKVAVGDLSDGSHIGAAAYTAFTAVLIEEAAGDGRSLAFATSPTRVVEVWAAALRTAGVQRAIWVGGPAGSVVEGSAPEVAVVNPVGRTTKHVAQEVADLNDRKKLRPDP
jgi:putative NADH-flavin reductase